CDMIELNANQIAEATGGRLTSTVDDTVTVTAADIDSRQVIQDSLYIARRGEVTDGHNFISSARRAGAKLILAERETTDERADTGPASIVDDASVAMGSVAHCSVETSRIHSGTADVGITGSVGKTSTKDALAQLLATQGPTGAPQGSYNGGTGLPLTIF